MSAIAEHRHQGLNEVVANGPYGGSADNTLHKEMEKEAQRDARRVQELEQRCASLENQLARYKEFYLVVMRAVDDF